MDLANLMKSMSVNDSEQYCSTNFRVFGSKIGENPTDIVYGEFTNKYMIIATQYGKIGSLLKISVDQVENGSTIPEPVYSTSVIFGAEDIEQQAAARYIAEKLRILKPLMLFLCLKNYEVATINALLEVLTDISSKETNTQDS